MKKIIYLIIIFLFCSNTVFSIELEGGVKYSVDEAREYIQEGQENNIDIIGHATFDENDSNIEKIVYSYNNSHEVVGVTVQYKGEMNLAYIYVKNKLKYVDKYDRNVNFYPHRGYRYNIAGELVSTSLSVSKKEHFRFTPEGKLLAHSINGIIYDENGKAIGSAD